MRKAFMYFILLMAFLELSHGFSRAHRTLPFGQGNTSFRVPSIRVRAMPCETNPRQSVFEQISWPRPMKSAKS